MYFKVTVQLSAVTLTVDVTRMNVRWNISVLRRDLKVIRDGDDTLFQADVAESANARLPRVAWLTRGPLLTTIVATLVGWDRWQCLWK